MRKTFMASVAVAALIAATGFATAQGVNQGGMKGAESPAAASPKGDSAAPTNVPAAKAETATPGAAKAGMPQQAQDKGERSGVNAQSKPDAKATGEMKADSKAKESDSTNSKEMKNPTAETSSPADRKTTGEMKTDDRSKASDSATSAPNSRDAKSPTAETRSPASDNKTTGNAATSATAAPPAEKHTQIVSAIKQEKVEEVTNVNFNISIGTAVPSNVRYYPLPARIVEIYPEWRGFDFIRVHGRYIILRPHTREIVYIIEG
jgi:hypothetical protein